MRTVKVSDLEERGNYVRTQKRWLRYDGSMWRNVGRWTQNHTYFRDDEQIIDIQQGCPKLMEGDIFTLVDALPRVPFMPNSSFLFQIERNQFPFLVVLDNYRLTIPFHYHSTDPRVGIAESKWTCPAGQLMRHLNLQNLQILWKEDKPVLEIGMKMSVQSQ